MHGLHRLRRIRGLGSRFGNDVHWLRNGSHVVLCLCVEHRCAIGGGLIGAVLLPSDKPCLQTSLAGQLVALARITHQSTIVLCTRTHTVLQAHNTPTHCLPCGRTPRIQDICSACKYTDYTRDTSSSAVPLHNASVRFKRAARNLPPFFESSCHVFMVSSLRMKHGNARSTKFTR